MPDYKTIKIHKSIHDIYEKWIDAHDTIYGDRSDRATKMIKDVIEQKAKELLEDLN